MARGFLLVVFFPGVWESVLFLLMERGVLGSWREMARGAVSGGCIFFWCWESFLFLLNGKRGFG